MTFLSFYFQQDQLKLSLLINPFVFRFISGPVILFRVQIGKSFGAGTKTFSAITPLQSEHINPTIMLKQTNLLLSCSTRYIMIVFILRLTTLTNPPLAYTVICLFFLTLFRYSLVRKSAILVVNNSGSIYESDTQGIVLSTQDLCGVTSFVPVTP